MNGSRLTFAGHILAITLTIAIPSSRSPAHAGMTNAARLETAMRFFRTAEHSTPGSAIREISYRKAEELARKVVSKDPDSAEANFLLFAARGRRLLGDGTRPSVVQLWRFSGLRKYLTRTLELDPSHADALAAKGGILLDLPPILGGNVQEARTHLERALELNPTGPGTRLTLARALKRQGLVEPAREQARLAAHYACVKRTRTALTQAERFLTELDSEAL